MRKRAYGNAPCPYATGMAARCTSALRTRGCSEASHGQRRAPAAMAVPCPYASPVHDGTRLQRLRAHGPAHQGALPPRQRDGDPQAAARRDLSAPAARGEAEGWPGSPARSPRAGRTLNTRSFRLYTVPVFAPRGLLTCRTRVPETGTTPASRALL